VSFSLRRISRNLHHLSKRWIQPVLPTEQLRQSASLYARYVGDWCRYSSLPGAEVLRFLDSYPCLFDRIPTTPFDAHYFYQDVWAFKAIQASGASRHVDVGARAILVGMLTAVTKVTFVDIRPLAVSLENFDSRPGSILTLPFDDSSVSSLSCLHVAEHIGLGRYGDALDPLGTEKATRELGRVLAPTGDLYFSVPVGKPRVCYNAHRIHSPFQILDYFPELELVEFSGVDDNARFRQDTDLNDLADASYACGLFHFTKKL